MAKQQRCRALLTLSNVRVPSMLRMPAAFVPKPHVLMRRVIGDVPEAKAATADWMIQTGDWDVF